jgi:hypothetical protein
MIYKDIYSIKARTKRHMACIISITHSKNKMKLPLAPYVKRSIKARKQNC